MKVSIKILLFFSLIFYSQSNVAQDIKVGADDNFHQQNWDEAIQQYEKMIKKNKMDSSSWYNLAISYLNVQNYDKAIINFEKADEKGFPISIVSFQKARAHVLNKNLTQAMATLKNGAQRGSLAYANINNDTIFDVLRNENDFKEALEKTKQNVYPCLTGTNQRHFDFWLGEWEVFVNGNKVGENSITMAEGGCAIHENYTTNGSYAGQSINYFDPIDKKWHQHWVGSAGDVYNYIEVGRSEGMLQFQSQFMGRNGSISLSRLTFTLNEDGSIRQFFENSHDRGKTWKSGFDGLYRPK